MRCFVCIAALLVGQVPILANEPPVFHGLLPAMVDARNLSQEYRFRYDAMVVDKHDKSVVSEQGYIYTSPKGFLHSREHGPALSSLPDIDKYVASLQGSRLVEIFDGERQFSLDPSDGRGYWVNEGSAAKPSALGFDFRAFGLAIAGDFVSRSNVEQVARNLQDWAPPKESRWLRDGVAIYQLAGLEYHIDIDRGCWPIYHRLEQKDSDTGEPRAHSEAHVDLVEINGQYLPKRFELKSKRHTWIYNLTWEVAPQFEGVNELDGFAVAEALGIELVEKTQ